MTRLIYTVSQVNASLKELLDGEPAFKNIYIKGEVSNFVHHARSGHFYFTLKDGQSSLRAVMFRWNTAHLKFMPETGMSITAFGSLQVYEKDGTCQLICSDLQPDGLGALYAAFEQLKARLEAEGLFDPAHKRPLPPMPRRIGVVTSKTGAAFRDIVQIIDRRFPLAEICLLPSLVQGEEAPASLCRAIGAAGLCGLDLLIVGRGGGSAEDLWCFNSESVARAVYHSPVPVISAVGHEIDYTICDFAADLRAPTPSAAAELAVPDRESLLDGLADTRAQLNKLALGQVSALEAELSSLKKRLLSLSPQNRLAGAGDALLSMKKRLLACGEHMVTEAEAGLGRRAAALEAMNPLKVLTRGYAAVFKDGSVLSSASKAKEGDLLRICFSDGEIEAEARRISPTRNEKGRCASGQEEDL